MLGCLLGHRFKQDMWFVNRVGICYRNHEELESTLIKRVGRNAGYLNSLVKSDKMFWKGGIALGTKGTPFYIEGQVGINRLVQPLIATFAGFRWYEKSEQKWTLEGAMQTANSQVVFSGEGACVANAISWNLRGRMDSGLLYWRFEERVEAGSNAYCLDHTSGNEIVCHFPKLMQSQALVSLSFAGQRFGSLVLWPRFGAFSGYGLRDFLRGVRPIAEFTAFPHIDCTHLIWTLLVPLVTRRFVDASSSA